VSIRPAPRTIIVSAMLALLLAGVAISVGTRNSLQRRERRLGHDATLAQAETRSARRELEAVQRGVSVAARDAEQERADAHDIEVEVVRIGLLRADVDHSAQDLKASLVSESTHRALLDPLLACRDSLDDAAHDLQLEPANTAGAIIALDLGTAQCAKALALTDGDTGAVHPYDFPDPSVIAVDGVYYAFGTNGPTGAVQVLSSTDLVHWQIRAAALAQLPAWAEGGGTWAPSVHLVGTTYVMYYAVRQAASDTECISDAVSTAPAGPYLDVTSGPLVCQNALGGSIDPDMYTDEHGFMHLTWRSLGAPAGQPAQLWSQYLTGDGTALLGTPYPLLTADSTWEGGVIENPSMTQVGGAWTLLYSANDWNSDRYVTAYATCTSENGPCTMPAQPILLHSTDKVAGPGGAQVFTSVHGAPLVAYAAWDAGHVGYPNIRRLHIARLSFSGGQPSITNLT
jgi:hypothetical protein